MKKLTESQKQEYRKALQALRAERTKRILEIARESDRDSGIPVWSWVLAILVFTPFVFLGPFVGLRLMLKRKILRGTLFFAITGFFCVMWIIAIFSPPPNGSSPCKGNQAALSTQLEAYWWTYGFFPREAEWDTFLNDPYFWPPGDPGQKYCPAGTDYPYEYKSDTAIDSVSVTNEHGTGYSMCQLGCIYDDCHNLDIGN